MARATMGTVIKNKGAKANKTGAKGGKKKASFNKQLHDNKGQMSNGLENMLDLARNYYFTFWTVDTWSRKLF